MLDRDVLVFESLRLVFSLHQGPAESLSDVDLAGLCAGAAHARAPGELVLDRLTEGIDHHLHLAEEPRHQASLLPAKREQEVLVINFLMAEADRGALRLVRRILALLC